MAPQKQQDGSYLLALPMPRETQLPTIDMAHDFGRYVLAAAQSGSPDQILAGGHYVSLQETANLLSQCRNLSLISAVMADNVSISSLWQVGRLQRNTSTGISRRSFKIRRAQLGLSFHYDVGGHCGRRM
jgi:hypothetical protein